MREILASRGMPSTSKVEWPPCSMTSSNVRLSLMRAFTFVPSSSSGDVLKMRAASGVASEMVSSASQMRIPSFTVFMRFCEMVS